jgi:hypothetical protein
MADFASWPQPNLASLAYDMQQQDQERKVLIAALCHAIQSLCDNDCKKPEKIAAYRDAVELLK